MIADVSNNVRKLWSETSLTIHCNPRNDIRIVWFLFVPDVCANHTCVNGDCLATSSKTWECRCYNGWKGQNCDIGMFISKKHVVIETEIFIKTQILHLKIRLIRSRKQSYFTNRCFFSKEDIVYKCNFELIDDPDCFLVEDTNDDFDFTRYYVCPVFLSIFFWTFYTFSYFEPELSEINYVLVNLRPVLKSQHIKNKYRD